MARYFPTTRVPDSWLDISHQDDWPLLSQTLDQLAEQVSLVNGASPPSPIRKTITVRCQSAEGTYKPLQWQLTCPVPLRHSNTLYIYGVVTDLLTFPDHHLQILVNTISDYAIYMLDPQGQIISWNHGGTTLHGFQKDDILGKPLAILYTPDQASRDKPSQDLEKALLDGRFEEEDYRSNQSGTTFWAHVVITALKDAEEEHVGFAVITRDITDRKQTEEQLRHDAFHDVLTGLPNAALFKQRLQAAFKLSQHQEHRQFAVLFLDLDRFKIINDSLGHRIGDELLVEIANRLRICLRSRDMVARMGGDEFAILLENITSVTNATEVAERIRQELSVPILLGSHDIYTNVSIGIAFSSLYREQAEDFLSDADTAMYRAKTLGRGRYEIFDEAMHTQSTHLMQIEHDLHWAIERQELLVYYQPIISLRSGQVEGFEALLRWQHPVWGMISPSEFIPVAEETGLIVPIGFWVLTNACRQVSYWQKQFPHHAPLSINVNLSARQFNQPDLKEKIQQILLNSHLEPKYLKLEITESVILGNAEQVSATFAQLKTMGIRLAIDDFGTGYSSLSYLHRYPLDTVKIDRSFIDRVDSNGEKLELVRSIITLAWNLGMDVVAEGVETNKQVSQLRALQCEAVQGYFFSEPLPSDAMTVWLAETNSLDI